MASFPRDKRQFYRHPISVPIRYQEKMAPAAEKTKSVDLSEGGLSFLADHFLEKGASVHLSIPVENEIFQIRGQVAYCTRLSSTGFYRTGVAFLDAMDAFRAKLAEELIKIKQYRDKLSAELGRQITEEQAAEKWIQKYAKHFSELF